MKYFRRLAFFIVFSSVSVVVDTAAAAAYRVDQGSVSKDKRVLTAGPQGADLTLQHGIKIRLSAGAVMRSHKSAKLWLDKEGRTQTFVFTLREGRVDVTVPQVKRPLQRAVLVQTSRKLTGAVSGGKMTVASKPSYGVVANYGGVVVARDAGRWSKVAPGHIATVTRTQPKAAQSALPKRPTLDAPQRVWLSSGEKVALDGFSWSSGKSSSFAWRLLSSGQRVLSGATEGKRILPGAMHVGPGVYELSVAALNSYGMAGAYSAPVSLNVVGVEATRGSRVDSSGTIHLGAEQHASFSNVEGLLMAYGKSQRWVAASTRVPVYNNQRTIVLFRHPQSARVVSARLQPRSVKARVRVGSKREQWPGDVVKLRVHLEDSVGGAQLQSVQPRVVVRVGLEEVPLTWQRTGSVLEAELIPRSGPGPWVVRATVYDQFGIELGRDFLEVTERPGARRQRLAQPPPKQVAAAGHP